MYHASQIKELVMDEAFVVEYLPPMTLHSLVGYPRKLDYCDYFCYYYY